MNGNLFGEIRVATAPAQECAHPKDARILNANLFAGTATYDEVCADCGATMKPNAATFNANTKGQGNA